MTRISGWVLKAVTTAAAVALVLGGGMLGCSGDDGEDTGETTETSGGNIVGDWMLYSYASDNGETRYIEDDPWEKDILTFKSSGKASQWAFVKVGNVWVEIPFEAGKSANYRTKGQTIYITDRNGKEDVWGTYSVSGDKLIVTDTWDDEECSDSNGNPYPNGCRTVKRWRKTTYKSVNTTTIRNGLDGPIYTEDTKLSTSTVYDELVWYLKMDETNYIIFSHIYAYGNGLDRYFGSDNSGAYYYTNGGKLFLVEMDCYYDDDDERHCTSSNPIEVNYSVSGSGRDAQLSIEGYIWLPAEYEDYEIRHPNHSPAKSAQGKRPIKHKTDRGSFPSFTLMSALKNNR